MCCSAYSHRNKIGTFPFLSLTNRVSSSLKQLEDSENDSDHDGGRGGENNDSSEMVKGKRRQRDRKSKVDHKQDAAPQGEANMGGEGDIDTVGDPHSQSSKKRKRAKDNKAAHGDEGGDFSERRSGSQESREVEDGDSAVAASHPAKNKIRKNSGPNTAKNVDDTGGPKRKGRPPKNQRDDDQAGDAGPAAPPLSLPPPPLPSGAPGATVVAEYVAGPMATAAVSMTAL